MIGGWYQDLVAKWPERFRDEWEERVAIMEYDAGLSRARAETVAYFAIKKQVEQGALT